jgi:serine/threonine-protein kinase
MADRPVDALFLEVQEALAGEYSLDRELGRGGMGVVYLAREVRLAREVALKVLPPELAALAEMREQFVREAQMAARLSHPNIVPIHRVGEAGAFVYFAMVYVPGLTLGQHLRTRGPLVPEHAIRVLREVAWALTYAHTGGLVHRDIKPDNIMLEHGTGRALVTDFGIAHASHAADEWTRDGRIVGTAHYMSPEQATGEAVDARSDIYSLGVVAFHALTGRLPFDGTTSQQVLAKHMSETPVSIRSLACRSGWPMPWSAAWRKIPRTGFSGRRILPRRSSSPWRPCARFRRQSGCGSLVRKSRAFRGFSVRCTAAAPR